MTSHNQLTIQYIKISKAEALNTTMSTIFLITPQW